LAEVQAVTSSAEKPPTETSISVREQLMGATDTTEEGCCQLRAQQRQ